MIFFTERQHYGTFHAFAIIRCLQANLQESSPFLSEQRLCWASSFKCLYVAQFFKQLLYKPHFGTWILPVGLLKWPKFCLSMLLFEVFFLLFSWPKNLNYDENHEGAWHRRKPLGRRFSAQMWLKDFYFCSCGKN